MLVHEIINCGRSEDLAIFDEGRKFTYAETQAEIKKFRDRLYALGVRKGDRVGIFSRNSAEFIFAYFATASLGAINVPINFQLSSRETAYILKNAEVKHVLTYEPLHIDEFFKNDDEGFAFRHTDSCLKQTVCVGGTILTEFLIKENCRKTVDGCRKRW